MARLAAADLTSSVNTTVYTVPSNQRATVTLSLCNRNGTVAANVRVAVCSGSGPNNSDYIEYDFPLPPKRSLERSGIILTSTQYLVVYSSQANVSAVVWGVEEQV